MHRQHRLPYRSLIERPRQEVVFFQQDGNDGEGFAGKNVKISNYKTKQSTAVVSNKKTI